MNFANSPHKETSSPFIEKFWRISRRLCRHFPKLIREPMPFYLKVSKGEKTGHDIPSWGVTLPSCCGRKTAKWSPKKAGNSTASRCRATPWTIFRIPWQSIIRLSFPVCPDLLVVQWVIWVMTWSSLLSRFRLERNPG